jgi:hypothetical protein
VECRFGLNPKIASYWTGEGACPYVVRGGFRFGIKPENSA